MQQAREPLVLPGYLELTEPLVLLDFADRRVLRVLQDCKGLRGLLDAAARLVQRVLVLLVNKGQSAQMELLEWLALAARQV